MNLFKLAFYSIIASFGYLPTSLTAKVLSLINIAIGCASSAAFLVSFNQLSGQAGVTTTDGDIKIWRFFLGFIVRTCLILNFIVHLQCFMHRIAFVRIKDNLEEWLLEQDMKSLMKKHIVKYIGLISIALGCHIIYMSLVQASYFSLLQQSYIFGLWTSRTLLFLVVVDVLKMKLALMFLKSVDSAVVNSHAGLAWLQDEFQKIQNVSNEINKTAKWCLIVSVFEAALLLLDILYWGIVGVFKAADYKAHISKVFFLGHFLKI